MSPDTITVPVNDAIKAAPLEEGTLGIPEGADIDGLAKCEAFGTPESGVQDPRVAQPYAPPPIKE